MSVINFITVHQELLDISRDTTQVGGSLTSVCSSFGDHECL